MSKTHSDLVEIAARWLRNTRRCRLVICERIGLGVESPDAIGWKSSGDSLLVECKISRADFLRDRKKVSRRSPELYGRGLGRRRYYLTLPEIARVDDLPDGWGLLELHSNRRGPFVRVIRDANTWGKEPHFMEIAHRENMLLYSYASNLLEVPTFLKTEIERRERQALARAEEVIGG